MKISLNENAESQDANLSGTAPLTRSESGPADSLSVCLQPSFIS